FDMQFNSPRVVSKHGRYLMATAILPAPVEAWRKAVSAQISRLIVVPGRTSAMAHLTIAAGAIDPFALRATLDRAPLSIPSSTVNHVDLALAGEMGAKLRTLVQFDLSKARL